jgi:ABC-type transporter Mla MlaB component
MGDMMTMRSRDYVPMGIVLSAKKGPVMEGVEVRIKEKRGVTEVVIVGEMTIVWANELKSGLQQAFARGKKVQISLAGVTDADLAGMQLLCSSHRTSIDKEQGFDVVNADVEAVWKVAKRAGLHRQTGCSLDVNKTCVWCPDER